MTNQNYRHYVLIIDRSGSMTKIAGETQSGVRVFVSGQREILGKATLSLYQFDHAHDRVHDFAALHDVPPYTLVPRGATALLDACGFAITETGEKLSAMPEQDRPGKVIVLIATDGRENSSREYTLTQVRDLTTRQREMYRWEFSYVGANQDSFAEASNMGLSVNSAMDYDATATGTRNAWAGASASAGRYAGGQSAHMDFTDEERAASKGKSQ